MRLVLRKDGPVELVLGHLRSSTSSSPAWPRPGARRTVRRGRATRLTPAWTSSCQADPPRRRRMRRPPGGTAGPGVGRAPVHLGVLCRALRLAPRPRHDSPAVGIHRPVRQGHACSDRRPVAGAWRERGWPTDRSTPARARVRARGIRHDACLAGLVGVRLRGSLRWSRGIRCEVTALAAPPRMPPASTPPAGRACPGQPTPPGWPGLFHAGQCPGLPGGRSPGSSPPAVPSGGGSHATRC